MAKPAYRKAKYQAYVRYLADVPTPCVWCGRRATTADHAIPVALGGTDDDLVPSCKPCNDSRGGKLAQRLRVARVAQARAVGMVASATNDARPSRAW